MGYSLEGTINNLVKVNKQLNKVKKKNIDNTATTRNRWRLYTSYSVGRGLLDRDFELVRQCHVSLRFPDWINIFSINELLTKQVVDTFVQS